MSTIKTVYVAVPEFTDRPVVTADSFKNLQLALDDYCGINNQDPSKSIDPYAKRLGFEPANLKYPDEFEGTLTYEVRVNPGGETVILEKEEYRVYCLDFWTSIDNSAIY